MRGMRPINLGDGITAQQWLIEAGLTDRITVIFFGAVCLPEPDERLGVCCASGGVIIWRRASPCLVAGLTNRFLRTLASAVLSPEQTMTKKARCQVYAGVKAKFALQALWEQATGICLAAYDAMS